MDRTPHVRLVAHKTANLFHEINSSTCYALYVNMSMQNIDTEQAQIGSHLFDEEAASMANHSLIGAGCNEG